MLTKEQIKEIKEHLDKAQNPLFFFDNDPDGLCSFLLLQRYLGRGKGVAVRSYPEMDANYFRRVNELDADYIFILDKPVVSKGFFEAVRQVNIPVVWIDHHEVQEKVPDFVNYYNVVLNKPKTNEPVTALCYQITERKEDLWLAVIGCISDHFIPEFYPEFLEKYPDLGIETDEPFKVLYESQIGRISSMLNFSLKDSITNVVRMQKFLMKAKTPYEVLEENKENKSLREKFNEVDRKSKKLVKEALEGVSEGDKIIFFQYAGELSISSEISNELMYRFPEKYIVVMRVAGGWASASCRGKNIRKYLLKALEGLEDATGGGHRDAVGARVKEQDVEKFKENMKHVVEDSKI